jgi:hypothetical protein
MSKFIADSVRDNGLTQISGSIELMHINSNDPADRPAALASSLGSVLATYDAITGTGTRTLTAQQKTGVAVSAGNAVTVTHVSVAELLWKTDVVGAPVAVAGTATINAHSLTSGAVT